MYICIWIFYPDRHGHEFVDSFYASLKEQMQIRTLIKDRVLFDIKILI